MADHPAGFFQGTEMPAAGWWEALWPDPAGVLYKVGVRAGMDVIDLCSGDGWFTLQIAKVARHVSAIDIDPTLLQVARHRLVESEVTNCKFIAGEAYDIAKLAGPADFVFMRDFPREIVINTPSNEGTSNSKRSEKIVEARCARPRQRHGSSQ